MIGVQNTVHEPTLFSDLYTACVHNDYLMVLGLLESSDYKDINRREPNGSTALHEAAALGHANIVHFLLNEYSVDRNQKNLNNRTAYEVASNDEIRQLFHRPKDNIRFFSNDDSYQNVLFTENDNNNCSSDRVERYRTKSDVKAQRAAELRKEVPHLVEIFYEQFRRWFWPREKSNEELWASALFEIIEQKLGKSHAQYFQARELIQRYLTTSNIEPLLCLYTLETPFYRYLTSEKDRSRCLALPMLARIQCLHERVFKGDCYRGLSMTCNDLKAYEWARDHEGSYLEMNTFCSTSDDKSVAEHYMEASKTEDKIQVLMKFSFVKTCRTAIQLFKISNDLPSLSNFENEREILILPGTFFTVKRIDIEKFITKICLEHFNFEEDDDWYRDGLYDQNLPDW